MSSSSDSDSIELTPESIRTDARNVMDNLLPAKSREKYMKAYGNFIEWRNARGAKNFSESVFLAYFQYLAKTKQPSTLWSTYSMLKSTVSSNNDVKLDTYSKLIAYLKRMSDGFKPKKSKVFSVKNVETFLNEAPDKVFLAVKVSNYVYGGLVKYNHSVLKCAFYCNLYFDRYLSYSHSVLLQVAFIFGVHGACRGNELLNITVDDVENHSGDLLLVKLTDTKTKIDRSFVIRGEYKNIVQKYLELRPADMKTNRFFIRYQNGKCFKQVMGKNKISNMPQEIATYLKLPDIKLYTGHCFRRTSATLLADSGADLTVLKRHGGWKSSAVAEGYIEDSIENKAKTCERIVENIKLQPSANPSMPLSPRPSTSKQRDSPSHFPQNEPDSDIISNTQNIKTISNPNKTVTINFHNCENVSNINISF